MRGTATVLGLAGYALVAQTQAELPGQALQNAAVVPFYALLVWGSATRTGGVPALLSLPPLVLLGEASYSLYLLHIPVWSAFLALGFSADGPAYAGYLAAALVASILMHLYFEAPMRHWILARWSARQQRKAPQMAV